MKRNLLIMLFLAVLTLAAVGGWAWMSAPRLLDISPAAGSRAVPAGTALRLAFSQPLQLETVRPRLKLEPARSGQFSWEDNTLIFTPDAGWPAGSTITVTLQAGARSANWPGLPVWQEQQWGFRTSQVLLAYLWPAGETADLYALDPLSGEIQQWTQTGGIQDFSANSDGTILYFSRQNRQGGSDLLRLSRQAVVNDPKAEPELLLACPDALCRLPQPSWDDDWLAYERAPLKADPAVTQVWLLPLSGGEPQPVSELNHSAGQPTWAHSGWLSFYDRDQNAYVLLDPASGKQWQLPNHTGEAASWEPEGRAFIMAEILFEPNGLLNIYASSHLLRYDLPDPSEAGNPVSHDLTQDVALEDTDPVYAPDGSRVAFARKYLDLARWSPGRQLWVMSANGQQARKLTDDLLYNHYDFSWSLDGQQIAYVRFNQTVLTLPPELWLIQADGSNPIQLVIGGYAPQWVP